MNLFTIDNLGLIVPAGLVIAMIIGEIQRYREKKLYGDSSKNIESDFYISRKEAVEELAELKRMYDREDWTLESYNIDDCD